MFLDSQNYIVDAENDVVRPIKWQLHTRKMAVFRPAKGQLSIRKITALSPENDILSHATWRLYTSKMPSLDAQIDIVRPQKRRP